MKSVFVNPALTLVSSGEPGELVTGDGEGTTFFTSHPPSPVSSVPSTKCPKRLFGGTWQRL